MARRRRAVASRAGLPASKASVKPARSRQTASNPVRTANPDKPGSRDNAVNPDRLVSRANNLAKVVSPVQTAAESRAPINRIHQAGRVANNLARDRTASRPMQTVSQGNPASRDGKVSRARAGRVGAKVGSSQAAVETVTSRAVTPAVAGSMLAIFLTEVSPTALARWAGPIPAAR